METLRQENKMLFGLFKKRPKPKFSVAKTVRCTHPNLPGLKYLTIQKRRFSLLKGEKEWVYEGEFLSDASGTLKPMSYGHMSEYYLREL